MCVCVGACMRVCVCACVCVCMCVCLCMCMQIGEEDKRATKVVWDGHTASMEKVSQRARENISIEEQIATIHKTKGLL